MSRSPLTRGSVGALVGGTDVGAGRDLRRLVEGGAQRARRGRLLLLASSRRRAWRGRSCRPCSGCRAPCSAWPRTPCPGRADRLGVAAGQGVGDLVAGRRERLGVGGRHEARHASRRRPRSARRTPSPRGRTRRAQPVVAVGLHPVAELHRRRVRGLSRRLQERQREQRRVRRPLLGSDSPTPRRPCRRSRTRPGLERERPGTSAACRALPVRRAPCGDRAGVGGRR